VPFSPSIANVTSPRQLIQFTPIYCNSCGGPSKSTSRTTRYNFVTPTNPIQIHSLLSHQPLHPPSCPPPHTHTHIPSHPSHPIHPIHPFTHPSRRFLPVTQRQMHLPTYPTNRAEIPYPLLVTCIISQHLRLTPAQHDTVGTYTRALFIIYLTQSASKQIDLMTEGFGLVRMAPGDDTIR